MEFSNKTSQNNDGEGDGGVVRWWESRERRSVCVCEKEKKEPYGRPKERARDILR